MIKRGKAFVEKYNWDFVASCFDKVIEEEYSQLYSEAVTSRNSGKSWNPCRKYPDWPNNGYDPSYIG